MTDGQPRELIFAFSPRPVENVNHSLNSQDSESMCWKKLYQDESLTVSLRYFKNLFNTKANIGFGLPSVDVHTKCWEMNERIKAAKSDEEKQTVIIESTLLEKRDAAFSLFEEKRGKNYLP
ncbi:hypothetical protein AVEN_116598-1 [Araneus ventricosus]|uniref:Uncharacterized protein n=1 Tax=Araneus ventricosus TaxID=182803 RepID=A0A4Y2DFD6_ARAVE|nr:hypothetical protein AVEN_116598-1 [Araneus ventricosus]